MVSFMKPKNEINDYPGFFHFLYIIRKLSCISSTVQLLPLVLLLLSISSFYGCKKPEPVPTIEKIFLETEHFDPEGKPKLYLAIDAKYSPDDDLAVLYENRGAKLKTDYKLLNRLITYNAKGKKKYVIDPGLSFAHSLIISPENTYIISDHGNNRILEIDRKGNKVLEIKNLQGITALPNFNSATLTAGGNILACIRDWGIAEFDRQGNLVWQYQIESSTERSGHSHGLCHDANEISGKHILYAKTITNEIFEINRQGEIVWKFSHPNIKIPKNAKRMKNGNTIIKIANIC